MSLAPHQQLEVSAWVEKYSGFIDPKLGLVLDLACGKGRHAKYLMRAGYAMLGLDRNIAELTELQRDECLCVSCDLESNKTDRIGTMWPFAPNAFAAIIVTNYLYRPLLPALLASIKENGILIYETFAVGNEAFGRPKNPDFLLRQNELLELCLNPQDSKLRFECLGFEHGLVNQPSPAIVQRICARRCSTLETVHSPL